MIFSCLFNQTKSFLFKENKIALIKELKIAGITDNKILNAIKIIPREMFIKESFKTEAYKNIPLPIDCGQTVSQPYIVAYMISCLNLKKDSKVLEVGTGTGYQAALISYLCKEVCTIEIFSKLLNQAIKNIEKLNIKNVTFKLGNGIKGWNDGVLFDSIIISAKSKFIPNQLLNNLKDGGRLIMPKEYSSENQKLVLVIKKGQDYLEKELLAVKFVNLLNQDIN